MSPRDVVLGVERTVIGFEIKDGSDIQNEAGEITAAGVCSPKTECAHVSALTMDRLVTLVRRLGEVHHRKAEVSPHYGFRVITVRWDGGRCNIADGVLTPIEERDAKKFYAAYDAIRDAILKSRGPDPQ